MPPLAGGARSLELKCSTASGSPSMSADARTVDISRRTRLAAALLASTPLFGALGLHLLSLGRTREAYWRIAITLTLYGAILTVLWAWFDCIFILSGEFVDQDGSRVLKWLH